MREIACHIQDEAYLLLTGIEDHCESICASVVFEYCECPFNVAVVYATKDRLEIQPCQLNGGVYEQVQRICEHYGTTLPDVVRLLLASPTAATTFGKLGFYSNPPQPARKTPACCALV